MANKKDPIPKEVKELLKEDFILRKRCPFCNQFDLLFEEFKGTTEEIKFYVLCPCCGGRGPLGRDKKEAASYWNGEHPQGSGTKLREQCENSMKFKMEHEWTEEMWERYRKVGLENVEDLTMREGSRD